jgi:hypothetical protein
VSSSGGNPCPSGFPTGQCSQEGQTCGYGDNDTCGTTCQCEGGEWGCYPDPCVPPPPPACPPTAPPTGSSCPNGDGLLCDYSSGATCNGVQCSCDGSLWTCAGLTCPPPPSCPTFPPAAGTACSDIYDSCVYYINGTCNEETCECDPSGSWTCTHATGCDDAGILPP